MTSNMPLQAIVKAALGSPCAACGQALISQYAGWDYQVGVCCPVCLAIRNKPLGLALGAILLVIKEGAELAEAPPPRVLPNKLRPYAILEDLVHRT